MTQADKLEALVYRAIEQEWKPLFYFDGKQLTEAVGWEVGHSDVTWIGKAGKCTSRIYQHSYALLFDHEFAKALLGTSGVIVSSDPLLMADRWVYELQRAVISNDPIDYLYGAVFGNDNS